MAHPPIKLKQSAAQTLTTSSSAQDARLLVRETLRISSNLVDSAAQLLSSSSPSSSSAALVDSSEFLNSSFRLICCEEMDGRRWSYVAEKDASGRFKKGSSIRALSTHTPPTPPIEMPNLSTYWLLIQYYLIGIAEVFSVVGLLEFLYEEAPNAMKRIGSAYAALAGGFGLLSSHYIEQHHQIRHMERRKRAAIMVVPKHKHR